ncbi:conjugative transposon protein TraN [Ferruginibacter sp.]
MKYLLTIITACMLQLSCTAQKVQVSTDKTTTLVFPFAIRHADRGTKDILIQPVKDADNILLVKAASKEFSYTNLSVVTVDGSVYSFPVEYAPEPSLWIYQVPPQQKTAVSTYANGIADNPLTIRGIRDQSWKMDAAVSGIYIKDNTLYYQLALHNHSSIDYDIEFLRFYIWDKKKSKRTAAQENELLPLYISGNTTQVKANTKSCIVIALEKFTIPDAKYLAIEINEKNGGRHLLLKVHNNKIVKAILLPDLK